MARHKAKSVVNDVERLLSWTAGIATAPASAASSQENHPRQGLLAVWQGSGAILSAWLTAKLLLMAKLHMKVDFIKKNLAAVKYGK